MVCLLSKGGDGKNAWLFYRRLTGKRGFAYNCTKLRQLIIETNSYVYESAVVAC
jgi:hypothetical protein